MSEALSRGLQGAGERAKGMASVFQGFKDFISRGNAIELAVGVIIGVAFGSVVASIQNGLLNPLIGWIFGQPSLTELWNIGPYTWATTTPGDPEPEPIRVGVILDALLQFLITAAAIYFLIVLPLNKLAERRKRGVESEPAKPAEDILLLQQIRDLLAGQVSPSIQHDVAEPGTPGTGTPGTSAPGTGRHRPDPTD
ncbi:large conductance mechanosensitive channel protein MscL [Cellulomonas hominis]